MNFRAHNTVEVETTKRHKYIQIRARPIAQEQNIQSTNDRDARSDNLHSDYVIKQMIAATIVTANTQINNNYNKYRDIYVCLNKSKLQRSTHSV